MPKQHPCWKRVYNSTQEINFPSSGSWGLSMHEILYGKSMNLFPVTTASITESSLPFPQPPLNELHNHIAWATIHSNWHLFCITTLINVEHFHSLLLSHPNCPLIMSVCRGLCEGFWPWAQTEGVHAPPIVDNASLQKVRDLTHLAFIYQQHDEEVALHCFSDAYYLGWWLFHYGLFLNLIQTSFVWSLITQLVSFPQIHIYCQKMHELT